MFPLLLLSFFWGQTFCEGTIIAEVRDEIDQETRIHHEIEVDYVFDNSFVYSDDIPDFISFGRYDQKTISEAELRERIDPRVKNNCKYCDYPNYENNFHHGGGFMTLSDAFVGGYGEYIYLVSNLPSEKECNESVAAGNVIYTKDSDYENSVLEVYPVWDEESETRPEPILIEAEKAYAALEGRMKLKILLILFPMKEELLDQCFHVLLKHKESGHNYLTKPMMVRHCDKHKLEDKPVERKKHRLAVCTMMYNKDRWMLEWIEWHRMIGVTHFYIYMHVATNLFRHLDDDEKEVLYDTTFSLLDDYVKDGIVTLLLWNYTRDPKFWSTDQDVSGVDCSKRFEDDVDYMLLIDDDEFLVPLGENRDALSVIDTYEKREPDLNFVGFSLFKYDFLRYRMEDSKLSTQSYQWVKIQRRQPKLLLRPEHARLKTKHFVLLKDDEVRDYSSIHKKSGMALAHYEERKFHEFNPIKAPKPVGGKEDWFFRRIQSFGDEIRKRVEEMEKKVEIEKYEFRYNDYYPDTEEEEEEETTTTTTTTSLLSRKTYGQGVPWYEKRRVDGRWGKRDMKKYKGREFDDWL